MVWELHVRGGAFDGHSLFADGDPLENLIVWRCRLSCNGHGTYDAADPNIVQATAVVYRRVRFESDERTAMYELPSPENDTIEIPTGDFAFKGLPPQGYVLAFNEHGNVVARPA
jgi:hypothetical protein